MSLLKTMIPPHERNQRFWGMLRQHAKSHERQPRTRFQAASATARRSLAYLLPGPDDLGALLRTGSFTYSQVICTQYKLWLHVREIFKKHNRRWHLEFHDPCSETPTWQSWQPRTPRLGAALLLKRLKLSLRDFVLHPGITP